MQNAAFVAYTFGLDPVSILDADPQNTLIRLAAAEVIADAKQKAK